MKGIFRDPMFMISTLLMAFVMSVPSMSLSQDKKIAVFGSSVAKGSGDTTGTGGYAGMIKSLMENRGWSVVNVSRGGDNTVKIMPRFETELLPEKPRYVIIGLSLGNEGIAAQSELTRRSVFERFRSGLQNLVERCRENGMVPVVVNCYARNDFGPDQYQAVQEMNMVINAWNVPSINVLGAIDDGTGKWVDGYWHDRSHPNVRGHREMFYSFVPGLFDALAAGMKCPRMVRSNRYLSVSVGAAAKPLVYIPDDTIHSFTIGCKVKSRDDGVLATLNGNDTHVTTTLRNSRICYNINGKEILAADTSDENKGWQYVVVSYRFATGTSVFYVNGKVVGSYSCPLDFREFILGGSGNAAEPSPLEAGYKELLIYRTALNAGEVLALYYDQMLQSSLEVYAPLDDLEFRAGTFAGNHAQSMSKVLINEKKLVSATEQNAAGAR